MQLLPYLIRQFSSFNVPTAVMCVLSLLSILHYHNFLRVVMLTGTRSMTATPLASIKGNDMMEEKIVDVNVMFRKSGSVDRTVE